MDSLDMMRASRVAQSAAWESECLALATKIVQKHGGKGEGGHLVDRLIFLDAKLTELENRLAKSCQPNDGMAVVFQGIYTLGRQPCANFVMASIHECYHCGATVAFCERCSFDHHENGYERCSPRGRQCCPEEST